MKIKDYRDAQLHYTKDDRGDATGAFEMFVAEEPSSMVPEPRSNYSNGLSVDPIADSEKKIGQALTAYKKYRMRSGRRLKKDPVINFDKFFELYAEENFAEGGQAGQLVQPNDDGSRPGYMGKSYKPGNPAYEAALEKSRQLSANAPEGMKYDRKLKKYVKSKLKSKENIKKKKEIVKFVNDKIKNKEYVSVPEIAKNVKGLNLKEGALSADKKSTSFINRVLENNTYRNKPLKNYMGKQEYQDTRAAGFLKKAKTLVSDQEKILDLAMSGKYKTADEIKKVTNISAEKFEKELIKLYSNIYEERNRVNQGLKKFSVFLPRDEKQLKNILNVFADIDGFQGPETRSIFKLVRETYGKEGTNPNMKKYKQATSKLIDYYGTVKEIQKKYPKIKLDLEHPLDFKTIEGLGKKGEKFLHITPVSENLNRGLFKVIGTQYRSALESGDAKFIQNVEKLADDLGINIGKVKGKKIKDFGTSIIGESDFKKEIIENLKKQNVIADKVNPMQKSGELKKRLLEIGVKKPKDYNITKIQEKGIAKKLEAAGYKCQLANGLTCNDPRAYTQSIKENMAKVKQGDNAAVAKVAKLGKAMNAFKGAAKFTGWTLLAEVGFAAPLAAVDYAKGANRDEIISNATYGLFGKSEEEQLKEKYADYGKAQEFQDTYDNLLEAENLAKTGAGYRTQALNKLKAEELDKKLFEQSKQFNTILPPSMGFKGDFDLDRFYDAKLRDQQTRDEFAKEKELTSKERGILQPSTGLEDFRLEIAGGGIAGLSGGDKSGRPPESGPASQGLRSLFNNGKKR